MYDELNISTDLDDYVELLHQYLKIKVDHVYLHNVNTEQKQFIQDFGENVLPHFNSLKEE